MTAVPLIPVLHFELSGESFVPIAVGGESQDRPFAALVRGAKADLQFASSFSLTWLAPLQRDRTVAAMRGVEPISRNRSLPSRVQFRHFPGPKSQNQSFEGDDQFSASSVGIAAIADRHQCPVPDKPTP